MELRKRKQRRRGSGRGSVRRSVYEREPGPDDRPAGADRPARAQDTAPPGDDEKAPGPDRPAADAVATKGAKVTPLFVSDPGPRSKRAALVIDEFGHARKTIEAESEEAASHWDARVWHPL